MSWEYINRTQLILNTFFSDLIIRNYTEAYFAMQYTAKTDVFVHTAAVQADITNRTLEQYTHSVLLKSVSFGVGFMLHS